MRENADFGALKTESLHHYCFTTREQARQVVFEYIEVFDNRIRRHAKIGNQVPADFANQLYAGKKQSCGIIQATFPSTKLDSAQRERYEKGSR